MRTGQFKDLSGMKFGSLTLLERSGWGGSSKGTLWRGRCDCGNEVEVLGKEHSRWIHKTCGDLNCPYRQRSMQEAAAKRVTTLLESTGGRYNVQVYRGDSISWGKFGNYRRGAKVRGYTFKLNYEQFQYLIIQDCHYCGCSPNTSFHGVDRVDNTEGYHIDNCVPCCTLCNRIKMDLPYVTFKAQVLAIASRLTKN